MIFHLSMVCNYQPWEWKDCWQISICHWWPLEDRIMQDYTMDHPGTTTNHMGVHKVTVMMPAMADLVGDTSTLKASHPTHWIGSPVTDCWDNRKTPSTIKWLIPWIKAIKESSKPTLPLQQLISITANMPAIATVGNVVNTFMRPVPANTEGRFSAIHVTK